MIYINYYISALKNYFNFSGRASRSEYWIFSIINFIIIFLLAKLADSSNTLPILLIIFLFSFFIIIPSISISIRRLHDIGKSGMWYLIKLIPLGALVFLVLMCMDGQPFDNEYGIDPKSIFE